MLMDFTFKLYESSPIGNLTPSDLNFFYYDVAEWSEINQLIEMGNNELKELALKLNIKLIPITDNREILSIQFGEIIFKVYSNETYQAALFRHLRNSFSHFRITYRDTNNFYMEDYDGNDYTMLGLVECDNFYSLIFQIRNFHEEHADY